MIVERCLGVARVACVWLAVRPVYPHGDADEAQATWAPLGRVASVTLASSSGVEIVCPGRGHHVALLQAAFAAVTAPTMPLLVHAKRKVGHALGSAATVGEGGQTDWEVPDFPPEEWEEPPGREPRAPS